MHDHGSINYRYSFISHNYNEIQFINSHAKVKTAQYDENYLSLNTYLLMSNYL